MKPVLVISLGGSLIVPQDIDVAFLKKFRAFAISLLSKYRLILVTGGGYTARKYIDAARQIHEIPVDELDWLGIKSTRINAQLIKSLMPREKTVQQIVHDPHEPVDFDKEILIAAGWKPGFSTDYDAVLLAKRFSCTTLLNMSNIQYVYTQDPKKFPDAQKITQATWTEFRKLVGDTWDPGLNVPFDPVASKEAQSCDLTVAILSGANLENAQKFLDGKQFEGTVISGK